MLTVNSAKNSKKSQGRQKDMTISKDRAKGLYETMIKIRKFEKKACDLFKEGLIRGPMHVYTGQEAIAAGACDVIEEQDYITSTHRGHGHCIAKGGELNKMTAELLGKVNGYSKGKGGSMHIADPDIGILGANGIVGGSIGLATGAGLSSSMKGDKRITICFFGDGASNQGVFHESLNLAAIWDLPVIYLCENNQYGLTGPADEMLAVEDISKRAASYDIPGVTIDGNDVLEVANAVEEAVERARSGEGPSLIEAKTYRWEGHFVGDPCVYVPEGELEEWKKRCPIKRFENLLLEKEIINKEEITEIEDKVEKEIARAEEYARKSPEPEKEELFEDLFA